MCAGAKAPGTRSGVVTFVLFVNYNYNNLEEPALGAEQDEGGAC